MNLNVTINEVPKQFPCQATDTLLDVLRREGYSGVKVGCANGDCGTCAVLLNGRTVNLSVVRRCCRQRWITAFLKVFKSGFGIGSRS